MQMVEILIFQFNFTYSFISLLLGLKGRCFKGTAIYLWSLLHWLVLLVRALCICTGLSAYVVPSNFLWVNVGAADWSIQFVFSAWRPGFYPQSILRRLLTRHYSRDLVLSFFKLHDGFTDTSYIFSLLSSVKDDSVLKTKSISLSLSFFPSHLLPLPFSFSLPRQPSCLSNLFGCLIFNARLSFLMQGSSWAYAFFITVTERKEGLITEC